MVCEEITNNFDVNGCDEIIIIFSSIHICVKWSIRNTYYLPPKATHFAATDLSINKDWNLSFSRITKVLMVSINIPIESKLHAYIQLPIEIDLFGNNGIT